MSKNFKNFASTVLIILLVASSSGCVTQTPCRHDPLKDDPAPKPELFSQCLREIAEYQQFKRDALSTECSTLLGDAATK